MRSRVAFLVLLASPLASPLAVKPKLTQFRSGGGLPAPAREPAGAEPGARDVLLKVYDISTPQLAKTLSLVTGQEVLWFPKLTVGVGGRVWSYDGEVERTVDAIVENAAGGSPLRTFNLGATALSDGEIDSLIERMGSTDYTTEEYDFFFRNCNHFCDDFTQRLLGDRPGCGADRDFIEDVVLVESESLLSKMPSFQQAMTRSVTRQVQKVIVLAWRKQWKRALAEYDEAAS